MHLTNHSFSAYGVEAEIEVDREGKFTAVVGGEEFEADTLAKLIDLIGGTLRSMRLQVPFVSRNGSRGFIRGHHAGRREMLISWSNGVKSSLSTFEQVLPGDTSDEVAARLETIQAEISRLQQERDTLLEAAVPVTQLFNLAAGENLTGDWQYGRNYAKEAGA